MKNAAQMIPPTSTAKETPQIWAKTPEIKLPKGINPANVNINILINLPLNSSGTKVCNKVFMRLVMVTEDQPISIRLINENKNILDNANSIKDIENIMEDKMSNLPLCLKSPKRANTNAAISAPSPAADISVAKPLAPTFNILLAKTGISII